jgi:hypothetical protein
MGSPTVIICQAKPAPSHDVILSYDDHHTAGKGGWWTGKALNVRILSIKADGTAQWVKMANENNQNSQFWYAVDNTPKVRC